MKNRESFFHLHMISDATGETLITVAARRGGAIRPRPRHRARPRHGARAEAARPGDHGARRASRASSSTRWSTATLGERLEAACRRIGIPCVSVLEPVLQTLQSYLGVAGTRRVGAQHVLDAEYFRRIDALNFTMLHDDGQLAGSLEEADVVLVGISRTSKTPTSIYLANRGIKTANIPIVPGIRLPAQLEEAKRPLIVGLTASPERIVQLRENRILGLNAAAHGVLCRQGGVAERGRLHPKALPTARLADHRRDPPLDRGDRGGDHGAPPGRPRRAGELTGTMARLILASKSPARVMLLKNAGISFEAVPASLDERAVEAPLIAPPVARRARSRWRSPRRRQSRSAAPSRRPSSSAPTRRWIRRARAGPKPASLEEARRHLNLSGRTHALHSGVAGARNGEIAWRHLDTARLTMRKLSASFIDTYLARIGERALTSVGAYQIEDVGIQLFERIEGDFFTILGLPLLPLLGWLRAERVIPS